MHEVAHWDDAPSETVDLGPLGGRWTDFGEAVGCRRVGASRIEVPAGKAATPLHAEDEEVFYVLAGSGWSVQDDGCFAVGAGDVVYYGRGRPPVAHTVVAGDDGLDVIAFGTLWPAEPPLRFPRLDAVKVGGLLLRGEATHQWELEAKLPRIEVKDPPDPRPATIVNVEDVEAIPFGPSSGKFVSRGLGATGIALNLALIGAGAEAAPPHCHSHEEELFVVLEGDGVVTLGESELPVRTGSIVGRVPGSGVAHSFRAGADGMTLLMFSDKHPGDMCFYPRTGKVSLRGLGITFQPEIVPWG